jgi:hypothetical protein
LFDSVAQSLPFQESSASSIRFSQGGKEYAVCPHGELVGDFHGFGATASIKDRHLLIHS